MSSEVAPGGCRSNWRAIGTCSTTASTCCSAHTRETAALFKQLNVALDAVVERRPFELHYPDGFRLQAARLPAPWHLAAALIAARGLGLSRSRRNDRVCFVRLKKSRWNIGSDRSMTEWLLECRQTPQVVRRVWRPLALAALNTPLDRASAQIFANVLRDSLGATGSASEMWVPRADLSALFPDAVERYVVAHGGEVLPRCASRPHRASRIAFTFDCGTSPSGRSRSTPSSTLPPPPTSSTSWGTDTWIERDVRSASPLRARADLHRLLEIRARRSRIARGFTALLDDRAEAPLRAVGLRPRRARSRQSRRARRRHQLERAARSRVA